MPQEPTTPLVELKALVTKIKADIRAGKTTETALADDLKQFDVLLAEHKGEKTDAVARILYMKAMLYDRSYCTTRQKPPNSRNNSRPISKAPNSSLPLEKREAGASRRRKKFKLRLVEGTQFPDFNEKDTAGKPLSIANYKGKVVLD